SKSGEQFVATDLGSEAGTFVNGERIREGTALKPGDLVAIGIHVLEARLIGGVTSARQGATLFTSPSASGIFEGPHARFSIESRVLKSKRIVIGRAPTCDVVIDHPSCSREHCSIEWDNHFILRDSSAAGSYVDDKRIVSLVLPPSCVLRIVDTLFRITSRGE